MGIYTKTTNGWEELGCSGGSASSEVAYVAVAAGDDGEGEFVSPVTEEPAEPDEV